MAEVITLSSSDEEKEQPQKKQKLIVKETATIVLSDEEDVEKPATNDKPPVKAVNLNDEKPATPESSQNVVTNTNAPSDTENEINTSRLKLTAFINKCLESITLPQIRERLSATLPKFHGHYEKLCQLNSDMKDLECMLDSDKNVTYDSYKAVVRFSEIFDFLKAKLKEAEDKDLFSGPKRQLLNKLEKTLLLVRKKIRKLDEAEVDFDDEENSNYMKAARYKERAQKIFKKICEMRKEDPNLGRLAYTKLNFTDSKYPIINKVLNKKYKNTIEFPTYFDMDRCIRKYVDVTELGITENALQAEIKFCFEKLGSIMKQRRKLDLYDTHTDYVQEAEDPALQNEEMEKKLQENFTVGNAKMMEVYEKYTRMQESGVNPDISSDSDDSNIANSD